MNAEDHRVGSAYFMVRIHSGPLQTAAALAGAIEDLGTGEKRTFVSGEELLRLLASWPNPGSKVSPDVTESNQATSQEDV